MKLLNYIPIGRQYIQITIAQMRETKQLLNINFKLFSKFSKLFLKLEDHMNPLVGDAEKLQREYKTFCNKRPTPVMRGLEERLETDQ